MAILLGTATLGAQAKPPDPIQKPALAQGARDVGIIFNTTSILLDLESYQAGLGIKVGGDTRAIRGLFDFVLNGASSSFSVTAGAALQRYMLTGTVRPYVGGSFTLGYMSQSQVISIATLSLGAIAGAEVFLLDFLSIFAEYAITADLALSTDLQTSQTTFDYLVDTGMGNNSRIGIVIYFLRAAKKK